MYKYRFSICFQVTKLSVSYYTRCMHALTDAVSRVFPLWWHCGMVLEAGAQFEGRRESSAAQICHWFSTGTCWRLLNSSGSYTNNIKFPALSLNREAQWHCSAKFKPCSYALTCQHLHPISTRDLKSAVFFMYFLIPQSDIFIASFVIIFLCYRVLVGQQSFRCVQCLERIRWAHTSITWDVTIMTIFIIFRFHRHLLASICSSSVTTPVSKN